MPLGLRCFLSLALLVFARQACAQSEPEPGARKAEDVENPGSQALELGHRGLEAYQRHDYRAALAAFSEAEKFVHSPVFVLYQARSRRELGDWLQARELFKLAARGSADEASPLAWRRAQQDALSEWAALQRRIPRIRVRVQGEFEPPLRVRIDDEPLPTSEGGLTHEAMPGEYRVTASDARGHTVEQIWFAREGDRLASVALVFPERRAGTTLSDLRSSAASTPREPDVGAGSRSSQEKGAYVAWGLGGASLLYGAIAQGVAIGKAQGVKSRCDGTSCPPEEEAVAERAETLSHMATAGLVVGLVGAATGTVLFATAPTRFGRPAPARIQVGVRGPTMFLKAEF